VAEKEGHKIDLAVIKDGLDFDSAAFDKIVIGASIRYGKHRPVVYDFIRTNRTKIDSMPNAFFTVNLVRCPQAGEESAGEQPLSAEISQEVVLATAADGRLCRENRLSDIQLLGSPDHQVDHVDDRRSDRPQVSDRFYGLEQSR
jgi:hypothetical protein